MKKFIKVLIVLAILILVFLVGLLVILKSNEQQQTANPNANMSSATSSNQNTTTAQNNQGVANTGTKVRELVAQKLSDKTYTVGMEITYQGTVQDYTVSVNGNHLYFEVDNNRTKNGLLLLDDYLYIISLDDNTFTKTLKSDLESAIEDPFIKIYTANQLPTGTLSLDGIEYYCEIVALDGGGEDRYCFDTNGNLVYVVTYLPNETTSELQLTQIAKIVYIADTIDETLFANPAEKYIDIHAEQ